MSRWEMCPLCQHPYPETDSDQITRLRKQLHEAIKLADAARNKTADAMLQTELQKRKTREKAELNGQLAKKFARMEKELAQKHEAIETQCVRLLNENATLRKSQRMTAETEKPE